MEKIDEDFLCEHCNFSIRKLKEMAEIDGRKEMFTTFRRKDNFMNIYEVNTEKNFITMRRSTGKFTRKLEIDILVKIHNAINSGQIDLDPKAIDYFRIEGKIVAFKWGNYIASLLRHLKCQKVWTEIEGQRPLKRGYECKYA